MNNYIRIFKHSCCPLKFVIFTSCELHVVKFSAFFTFWFVVGVICGVCRLRTRNPGLQRQARMEEDSRCKWDCSFLIVFFFVFSSLVTIALVLRLSFLNHCFQQGNELKSPSSRILRERNVDRRMTATPKGLKSLFGTSISKRQDEVNYRRSHFFFSRCPREHNRWIFCTEHAGYSKRTKAQQHLPKATYRSQLKTNASRKTEWEPQGA